MRSLISLSISLVLCIAIRPVYSETPPKCACELGPCCENCTLVPLSAHKICRPMKNDCDADEICDGKSSNCPKNKFNDGLPCNGTSDEGLCFEGTCENRNDQCKEVFGVESTDCPDNYKLNSQGVSGGHCGGHSGNYEKCEEEDINCGSIHCHWDVKTWTDILMDNVITVDPIPQLKNKCYGIEAETSVRHLALVSEGTKCGDGKWCVNQKCVPNSRAPYYAPVEKPEPGTWFMYVGGIFVATVFVLVFYCFCFNRKRKSFLRSRPV